MFFAVKTLSGWNKMVINTKAYAKVNLSLDVLRRREDGYHDVKMIMQTVNIYDEITIEDADEGISISSDADFVPCDERNLMYKAAKLLMGEFNIIKGVKMHLNKNIPVEAGMAGGSTDAASVLKAVNTLFDLGLSEKELMERGVRIGADVPYCVMGGTALSEGIGEVLTRIEGIPQCSVLIAKPPIGVSTKYVYENLHAGELKWHPDVDGMIKCINAHDLAGIADRMSNVLETVTVKKYPEIERIKQFMKENGALNSIMSGSGPTVFGLYDNREKAAEAYENLKKLDLTKQLFLTEFAM